MLNLSSLSVDNVLTIQRHDVRDCACVQYEPDDLWNYKIRMNGENYYCSGCGRYVSSLKWKGGLIEMRRDKGGTEMRYKTRSQCPCCGIKMRFKRRAKNMLLRSIQSQIDNPKKSTPFIRKSLPAKVRWIETNQPVLIVT